MCKFCVSAAGQTRHITVVTNSEEVYRNVNDDLYLEHLTNITETTYVSWYWTAVHGCCRSVIGGNETEEGQAVCCRFFALEAWFRFQISLYGICGGKSGAGNSAAYSTNLPPTQYDLSV
jgi:hypothetical protein